MRCCLTGLLLLVAATVLAAWFVPPIVAGALVEGGLAAAGFSDTGTTVDVVADPPPAILAGHADRVRIRSSDVVMGDLRAARLDLTLVDVSLFGRTARTVDGTLQAVRIEPAQGAAFVVPEVIVRGPAAAAAATLRLTRADLEPLVASAVQSAGLIPTGLALAAPDRLTVILSGRTVTGTLGVESGALVARLDGSLSAVLARSAPGDPFQLRSVQVGPDGAVIAAVVDLAALIR